MHLGHWTDQRSQGGEIEWSSHHPTLYVSRYWPRLLPSWSRPVYSVLLLLQQSPLPLMTQSAAVEANKARLRDRALALSHRVVITLQEQGHLTALFDPKTGLPTAWTPGTPLDDVAVVQTLLGYRAMREGSCVCIRHPRWGLAVYPTTLLSTATPEQVRAQRELWCTTTAAPQTTA